jgi:hypothetical protein
VVDETLLGCKVTDGGRCARWQCGSMSRQDRSTAIQRNEVPSGARAADTELRA